MSAVSLAHHVATSPIAHKPAPSNPDPIRIGKPVDPNGPSVRLLPYEVPQKPGPGFQTLPATPPRPGEETVRTLPAPLPPPGRGIIDCLPNPPHLPPGFPPRDIDLPPWPPKRDPGDCGCQKDDTQEYRLGCFGPQSINLDSGRNGPDEINVTIHEDGGSTVSINGCEYNYDADETSRLSVGVDGNDNYNVQDKRSAIDKLVNPTPVKIYAP